MKPKTKLLIIALSLLFQAVPIGIGVAIGAVNNNYSTSVEEQQEVQTGLSLSETILEMNKGVKTSLTASVECDDTSFIYQWNSSDTTILTVAKDKELDTKCELSALSRGQATVSVNIIDKNKFKVIDSASCVVTVTDLSIQLSHSEVVISLADSNTATVTATGPEGKMVSWYSEDESIATVDNGVITAYKVGRVYIVAECGDIKEKVLVKVYNSLFSIQSEKSMVVNATDKLDVTGDYDGELVWSSSDSSVVEVNNEGVITAKKIGMSVIKLSAKDDDLSSECLVVVKDGEKEIVELESGKKATAASNPGKWYYLCESDLVTLNSIPTYDNGLITTDIKHVGKEDGTLSGNNFFYLRYQPDDVGDVIYKQTLYIYAEEAPLLAINGSEAQYKKGLNKIVMDFTSAAPKDQAPTQIKFKTACKYYIVADFEEISRIEKMTLSHSSHTLNLSTNKTVTLTATVPNQTNPTIEWVSSNSSVATVDNGVVTAVSKGNSMITATCGTFSATCMITVEDDGNVNETPLRTTNKAGVLESPGEWIYYVDGKSKLYSTPTIDENDNISLGIETIDTANKKYVFLRYQQEVVGTYNVTVTINYANTSSSVVDVTGGNQTTATTWTINNGDNSYNFTYTSDNSNPFQLKFYGVGYYNINVKFEAI